MDSVKAAILEEALKGKAIGPWKIERLKDHGKSAAVFIGSDGNRKVAVKIFDDELIQRYGDTTQLERIKRELNLIGKAHPNMVSILDGGFDSTTDNHYIVMEYLDGPNLKKCLASVPVENIPTLISQLASCAEFLERLNLVHRDIKPENIILLDDFKRLILLDFGVLRPVGEPGLTDDDGIQSFVGTLQYSSPEFLLRNEVDDVEGWRALSFYQIGGVLHDLIMRKELFSEFAQPYARLVNAVQNVNPNIQNSAVDAGLIDLARSCLLKDPAHRVRLLDWKSFQPQKPTDSGASAKQRVTNRALLAQVQNPDAPLSAPGTAEIVNEIIEFLKSAVRLVSQDNDMFPPLDIVHRIRNRDECKVRIRASEGHALPLDLTMIASVEVFDPGARAITLKAVGFVGEQPEGGAAQEPFVFFEGLYDSANVHSAFEECLYRMIDSAQQRASDAPAGWLAIQSAAEA
jgi:eukaryotic-like serine/threonine-protein kinase